MSVNASDDRSAGHADSTRAAVRPGVVTQDHARSDVGGTGPQEAVGTPFAGGAAGVAVYSLTDPSASSVSYAGPK